MPIRSVAYCSEAKAVEMQPLPQQLLISITEPGRSVPLSESWRKVLRYEFLDSEYDKQSLQFAGIDWWIASGAISPIQAERIRADLKSVHQDASATDLVVHCHAGESRSAAVAQYVSETFMAAMPQGLSRKANRTVLTLLRDPWCIVPREEFDRVMGSGGWVRATAGFLRGLLGRD